MVFGGKTVWVGLLAIGAATAGPVANSGQDPAQQQQTTPAQNNVPDAPRPQTLPTLNTINPVAPALPTEPISTTPPSENDDQAPPSKLPSSPASAAATTQDQDE